MITYEVYKRFILQQKRDDAPFLTFDGYPCLIKIYRDEFFAPQYIEGFLWDIGVKYNVWTVETYSNYYRHLWFDQIKSPVYIDIDIPHMNKHATLPLHFKIYDEDGVYFEQLQHICMERRIGDRFVMCSWRKIDAVRAFVESQFQK